MKTHRSFSPNRLVSHLRLAGVVTLLSAAAAMAFVAVKPSSPTLASQDRLRTISKFRGDRDELGGNKRTMPGDQEGGPLLAAIEDYAHRAYPAKDVPMTATLNALTGFREVKRASMGRPSVGAWQLIGPSKADVPDILTFSGAEYFTSGRVSALAIDPSCSVRRCRVWVGAAGGGVWRTTNALSGSGPSWTFVSDSFGTNAIGTLTYDAPNYTLYAGTGEANASGASEGGLDIWKSTDCGNTWTQLAAIIGPITTCSHGPGSGGVWRATDGGVTWSQIKTALDVVPSTDRAEFAVTPITGGFTRMYVGVGNDGTDAARFYRTDDAAGAAVFTDLTTDQNIDYCDGQCWYDNVVYSPPGKPGVVYLGGSFSYGSYGLSTNGRAFIRSADAGASFTDMTWDATTNPLPPGQCCATGNTTAANGQHPDSHAIVEIPGTDSAIFGGDGGLTRSSGAFADISSQCATRGLSGGVLALCQHLLTEVPTLFYNFNKGLTSIQFTSL